MRRAGAPAFPKREPKLRLVKNPDERPRPEHDSDLKAIIEDMNRHRRERAEQDPVGKKDDQPPEDAARAMDEFLTVVRGLRDTPSTRIAG